MAEPCEHEFHLDDNTSLTEERALCPLGDMCPKCHNVVELLYHPDVYKRRMCKDESVCPRDKLCAFAHSRDELEAHAAVFTWKEEQNPTEDFFINRYKTLWCPLPGVHDWDACIYAHTKRDIRRTPACGYSMRRCPDWEQALASEPKDGPPLPYNACCPRGASCSMAHGVKEALYHPSSYRTRMCSGAGHCRGQRRRCCAFAHDATEQRFVTQARNGMWHTAERLGMDPLDLIAQEQPQFHKPLVFAAFRDTKIDGCSEVPKTPSPEYSHREVLCQPVNDNFTFMHSDLACGDCMPLQDTFMWGSAGYLAVDDLGPMLQEDECTTWQDEQFTHAPSPGSASAMEVYRAMEDSVWIEDMNFMPPSMAIWPHDFFPTWVEETEQALPAHACLTLTSATQDGPEDGGSTDAPRRSLAAELLSAELPRLSASEPQRKQRDDESTVYGSHLSDADPTTASISEAHGYSASVSESYGWAKSSAPQGPGSSLAPGTPPLSPQLSEYRALAEAPHIVDGCDGVY